MTEPARSAAVVPVVALALGLALLSLDPARGLAQDASNDSQGAASVLADQVRAQGHSCDKPVEAHADPSLSSPDEKGWILTCSNATYSIKLRPGQAAQIDQISDSGQ